ncbi:hypothetical protein Dip518_001521 [Parelusimicrobium proximum]|uniref:hypothetical protein n=1 Tax=Parelusimicrobium proximum TaxID=3228953 RepID=UPI003D17337E
MPEKTFSCRNFVYDEEFTRELPGILILWCKTADKLSLLLIKESENIRGDIKGFNEVQGLRKGAVNTICYSFEYLENTDKTQRIKYIASILDILPSEVTYPGRL